MTATGPLLVLRNPSDQRADAPEERPVLSFAYRHFDRTVQGIRVLGMWFREPETLDSFDPCLVLLRPKMPVNAQTPCIVRLSAAYMFNPAPFNDEEHDQWVLREAKVWAIICDFCAHLGLNPMRDKDLFRVRGVIESHLEDLIRIPPAPPMKKIVHGEARLTLHEEGKTIETEVFHRG